MILRSLLIIATPYLDIASGSQTNRHGCFWWKSGICREVPSNDIHDVCVYLYVGTVGGSQAECRECF